MLMEADLAGDPLDDDEEEVESSECALPRPPLLPSMSCSD